MGHLSRASAVVTPELLLLGGFAKGGALAVVLAEDEFAYPDGALGGQNGGVGFAGAWSAGATITSGKAVVTTDGKSLRQLDFTFADAGELWGSFDMDIPADENTYGGLLFFVGTTVEPLLIGDRLREDVWGFGVPSGPFSNSTASTQGAKTVVLRVTLGAGATEVVDVWVGDNMVDPVDVGKFPDASTNFDLDLAGVDHIRIGHGGGGAIFDKIVIGETSEDVGAIASLLCDVNGDAACNSADLGIILDNLVTSGPFEDGDPNEDGFIDFADYRLFKDDPARFVGTGAGLVIAPPVPEPSVVLHAVVLSLLLAGRRAAPFRPFRESSCPPNLIIKKRAFNDGDCRTNSRALLKNSNRQSLRRARMRVSTANGRHCRDETLTRVLRCLQVVVGHDSGVS